MTMTLKLTAKVDLAEVRKQLAARQVDADVRDDVAAQKERLKRLEAQLAAMMHRQQGGQSSGHAPDPPPIDISAEEVQTWAAQGNVDAQYILGWLYANGQGVPQEVVRAAKWVEKSAAQRYAKAEHFLGLMYALGAGVPQDYVRAYMWSNVAAAHLMGTLQPASSGVSG